MKRGLLGEGVGPVNRYRHVSAMKAEGFSIKAAYDWLVRSAGTSEAEWDETRLVDEIHEVDVSG
jgi:hypothetical protein